MTNMHPSPKSSMTIFSGCFYGLRKNRHQRDQDLSLLTAARRLLIPICMSLLFACSQPKATRTILLLAKQEHFSLFTGEILRTEGFNHFAIDSLTDDITPGYLAG